MIDWSLIRNTIQSWVRDLSESPAIWEDQSENRPEGPYSSLKMITGPGRVGGHDQFENGEGNKFKTSGLREFTLSINIYRADAFSKAHYLNSSIEDILILERFQAVGLAYINATPVRDLTRLMGSRYESRFQFDVRFRIADSYETDPGLIENVEIENEINDNLLEISKP